MILSKGVAEKLVFVVSAIIMCFCANSFVIMKSRPVFIFPIVGLFVLANFMPLFTTVKLPSKRVHICNHGVKCLGLFAVSVTFSAVYHITLYFMALSEAWLTILLSAVVCVAAEAIIFWNGIICVYATSVQLGIKIRVLGVIFGFAPVANIIFLVKIIKVAGRECAFETEKYIVNCKRKEQRICATKYPLLMVHGVFFRDTKFFNYWGRIPKELEINGARIFYGEHQSAASVKDAGLEIAERIKSIVKETGCEKVNIIAHSKGGLDARYALANTDAGTYVASLVTINSPHRGCLFADYLLGKISGEVKERTANTYNSAMKKLGDKNPDFMAAICDLTSARCEEFNKVTPLPADIYCMGVGSKLNRATGGKFPLNFVYLLAKQFDGPNDGLVGEKSFLFGENNIFLTVKGNRGISHGDMIDLNREDIPDFDVREFYVNLVADLKKKGL